MKAGVHGYLLTDTPSEELAAAIRNCMRGTREVSQEFMFGSMAGAKSVVRSRKGSIVACDRRQTEHDLATALYLHRAQYVLIS
ncbi:Two-component response regulator yocG [Bacillus thuringiensis serovar israelensis ATCC 35646]|nr:Two-component response regulator yocG [Bacillus thuringiensis serovar israelensis ATCC 35646]